MIYLSMLINTVIFLLLFNWSYLNKRRHNPDYPSKPIEQALLFPIALGVLFTLLVDSYRGIMYYQLILFLLVGGVLFWIFYMKKKK